MLRVDLGTHVDTKNGTSNLWVAANKEHRHADAFPNSIGRPMLGSSFRVLEGLGA